MNINRKFLFNLSNKIFIFLVLIFISWTLLDNIFLKSIGKFFISNLVIRETFYLENNEKFKGTHDEAGERYLNTHQKYRKLLKTLKFKKIYEEIIRLKTINHIQTSYKEEFEIVSLLYKLSNEPQEYKKSSLIYISKNFDTFWNMSCDKHMTPLIVPAISNIAMIEGLPNVDRSCYGKLRDSGYGEYKKRNINNNKIVLSTEELCKKTKKFGFKRVIEINKDQDNIIKQIIHECA